MQKIRIWDWPTRLFHWLLVVCIATLVVSGQIGGDLMTWHFRAGYAVLTLLIFRFLWGWFGGHWSRWSQLPLSAAHVRAYIFGHLSSPAAGHNPLGSWSVVFLLLLCLLQVGSGLFADDEIANAGPLTTRVPGHWVEVFTYWHTHPGKWVLLALVALHVLAIAWYRLRQGVDLVGPMLTGDKFLPESSAMASVDGPGQWWRALLCLLISALCVWGIVSIGS